MTTNTGGIFTTSASGTEGVPVTGPAGTTAARVFRITNVRANANGLGASQTLIPTQIVAF
jgi:hypothetical protein